MTTITLKGIRNRYFIIGTGMRLFPLLGIHINPCSLYFSPLSVNPLDGRAIASKQVFFEASLRRSDFAQDVGCNVIAARRMVFPPRSVAISSPRNASRKIAA